MAKQRQPAGVEERRQPTYRHPVLVLIYGTLRASLFLKAAFSRDETLPLTIIIDREGTIRGTIAGILLPVEFDLQIKPLLQQRASERETNHVQKNE